MKEKELPMPPQAESDPQAFEVLRVWLPMADNAFLYWDCITETQRRGAYSLPTLYAHIGRSYRLNYVDDLTETTRTIRAAFRVEMAHVTDCGEGNLR